MVYGEGRCEDVYGFGVGLAQEVGQPFGGEVEVRVIGPTVIDGDGHDLGRVRPMGEQFGIHGPSELVEEFFRAFAVNSHTTLHIALRQGNNVHHSIEGIFKAFARALAEAVRIDSRVEDVPSTKGTL